MPPADITRHPHTRASDPLRFAAVTTTAELQGQTYKRGQKVRLVDAVAGHPSGSKGKIAIANGMTWKRYWVRFPDGTAAGHVDHDSLVRAKDYDNFLVLREREAIEAENAAEDAANAPASAPAAQAAEGDGVVVNGVTIPQLLLDRAAAARVRLGG